MLRLLSVDGMEDRAGPAHGAYRAAIAVCTANRPKLLRRCLESIGCQIVSSRLAVDVVVVDNEDQPNSRPLVEQFATHCPFPVHYVHEPRRGIPQARNAALEKCRQLGVDWVAFTDDDCWVSPTWVASHLDAAARHKADVVYGRREFVFPLPRPFWATRPEQDIYAEGQRLGYAGTHNVLLAMSLIGQHGGANMCFDERLSQGEDTDFFHRLARQGARIVYSAEPLVMEAVSPDRATLSYQTWRAYHYGASRSHFHRRYKGVMRGAARLAVRCVFHVPMAVARLAVAPFLWPLSEDMFRGLVIKGASRLAGVAGAAAGLLGFNGNPYLSITPSDGPRLAGMPSSATGLPRA
jgi:succinoglycan biosynthesis protein ExoM